MPLATYGVSQTYPDGAVRQHPRILFSVPLTLRYLAAAGIRASRGISLNISEGGVGALLEHVFPVGDAVEIDVSLPVCALRAVAIVRHSSSGRSGFEFLGLTPGERLQLAEVVATA